MCMAVKLYMQSGQNALHALVGYEDGTVAVWGVAAGNLLASKQLHAEPVMALAVAADGSGLHPPQRICVCKLSYMASLVHIVYGFICDMLSWKEHLDLSLTWYNLYTQGCHRNKLGEFLWFAGSMLSMCWYAHACNIHTQGTNTLQAKKQAAK